MTGTNQCTYHKNGQARITQNVVSIAPSISGEEYLVIELDNLDCIEVGLNTVMGLVKALPLLGEVQERMRIARME